MADRQRRRRRKAVPEETPGRQLPMSLWLLGLVPVLAIAFFGLWTTNRPSEPQPEPKFTGGARIAVDQESYDFGNVPVDKLKTYTFTIRNVGDQVLRLERQPQVRVLQGC